MALERELATYQANLMELAADEGKFVVIRGEEIAGVLDTYEDALEMGYEKFGLGPFLVRQIRKSEPIHYFSRDFPRCPS